MPLNNDRGLQLFDNLRNAVTSNRHTSKAVINARLVCSAGYPAICFTHLDEVSRVQRHVGVNVGDNNATQAMLTLHRPDVPDTKAPVYLLPIGDVNDMADLILTFLIQNINPIHEYQMKDGWKWILGNQA